MQYQEKTFQFGALEGLSEKQVEVHLGLYAGYVKNVNILLSEMERMKAEGVEGPMLAEVRRRFGFEYNGMRMHEYYFEQFEGGRVEVGGALKDAMIERWGSVEAWRADFDAVAKLRGIGWALLVQDERTGALHHVWVSDHELGQLGGARVILALDVWEHAFMVDYVPAERGRYIEAFFANVNWDVVGKRFA